MTKVALLINLWGMYFCFLIFFPVLFSSVELGQNLRPRDWPERIASRWIIAVVFSSFL